jgi:regulator of cell morphogenesis and NO signaling
MLTLDLNTTVGRLVAERPDRARVFERLGIDYCCGGRMPLAWACRAKGLDAGSVVRALEDCDGRAREAETDDYVPTTMGELVGFIVATHHAYLRRELPRLEELAEKVADAHGARHSELAQLRDVFGALKDCLEAHLEEEERVLFPMIKRLEARASRPGLLDVGGIQGTIAALEREHDDAGFALARIRALTGGFSVPAGACASYRMLLAGLAELETDMHHHVHRENNILFPEAIAAEERLRGNLGAGCVTLKPDPLRARLSDSFDRASLSRAETMPGDERQATIIAIGQVSTAHEEAAG